MANDVFVPEMESIIILCKGICYTLKLDQRGHRHSGMIQLSRARHRFASLDPSDLLLLKGDNLPASSETD